MFEDSNAPEDSLLAIDPLCDQFESELREQQSPKIEDYLARVKTNWKAALFGELLTLELEYHIRKGIPKPQTHYEKAYPEYLRPIRKAFRLVESLTIHLADAPAVLECRTHQIIDLPSWKDDWMNITVIGEVVGVHIREDALKDGLLDVLSYNPVARMGYLDYTTVTDRWEMQRPESEAWQQKFR